MMNLFVFLMLGLSAWAGPQDFVGSWSGQGTYILRGDMTTCPTFLLKFSATTDTITFESGHRECTKHKEDFDRVVMRYDQGKLYFGSQVVGSYDGNMLDAHYRAPDGNSFRNWRMSMRREGDHLVYEESRTMDGETTPMISFAGLLKKQP